MKTLITDGPRRRRQNGSTVLVLITLLIIMTMLAVANSKALFHLRREVKRLETQQVDRLNASQTNAITVVEGGSNRESK